jgi:hypothetical protein
MMDEIDRDLLQKGIIFLVGLLLSGNLFFVKRLVDSVDMVKDGFWQLRQDVVVHGFKIDYLTQKIDGKKSP